MWRLSVCLLALSLPGFANAEPMDLFTLYVDGLFDPDPVTFLPPDPAVIVTFTLPATPTGPLPFFYVGNTRILEGFTLSKVQITVDTITYDAFGRPAGSSLSTQQAAIDFDNVRYPKRMRHTEGTPTPDPVP